MTEKDITIKELRRKLKAYEDTGLEPEEILGANELAEVACALTKLRQYQEIGAPDHLREMVQAEKDRRLVVQKATPGNNVWVVERGEIGEPYDVSGYMFLAQVGDYVILSAYINDLDDLGSTMTYHAEETADNYDTSLAVFPAADCYLSREEADAALKGDTGNAD